MYHRKSRLRSTVVILILMLAIAFPAALAREPGPSAVLTSEPGEWQQVDTLTGANIGAIAVSPDFAIDATVLAATPRSIFKSVDGGETWGMISKAVGISLMVCSPTFSTDPLLLASGQQGLLRSENGGADWSIDDSFPNVEAIAFSASFATDNTVWVGDDNGLHISDDGGLS